MPFKKLDKLKLLKDLIDDLHNMTDKELTQWLKEYDFSVKKININDVANKELKSHGIKYKCFYVKLKNKNVCNYILVNSKGVVAYETGLYESLGNMIDMLIFDKEYNK